MVTSHLTSTVIPLYGIFYILQVNTEHT